MVKYYNFSDNRDLAVNNFWCIGRNYSDHAKEMGAKTEDEPIIFLKPSSAVVLNNSITLPEYSINVNFETELIFVIGDDCMNVGETDANKFIAGVGLGLDLTLRDIQTKLKEKSLPWALSKSFYGSAPVSPIIPYSEFKQDSYKFQMELNGEIKQSGDSSSMIFSIDFLISYLSKRFTLQKGDCIMTGTPAGVGKLNHNDRIKAKLENKLEWELEVL